MSVMRLPTGISIAQAKKDAKKLAKYTNVLLSEAQDIVARKHTRSSWSAMMNLLNNHTQLKVSLKQSFFTKDSISFPAEKSVTTVVGSTGSGKTLLLLEFIAQWLKHGVPVVYIGLSGKEREGQLPDWRLDAKAVSALTKQFGRIFRAYDLDVELAEVHLDGAILVLDEVFHLLSRNDSKDYRALINSSMHTFLGCQSLDEIGLLTSDLKNVSDDNLHVIAFHTDEFEQGKLSETQLRVVQAINSVGLTRRTAEFTEVLSINQNEVKKLRFRVKDHSAL